MVELLPVKQKVAGSSPAGTAYAVVAQQVVLTTCNRVVRGSSPRDGFMLVWSRGL